MCIFLPNILFSHNEPKYYYLTFFLNEAPVPPAEGGAALAGAPSAAARLQGLQRLLPALSLSEALGLNARRVLTKRYKRLVRGERSHHLNIYFKNIYVNIWWKGNYFVSLYR